MTVIAKTAQGVNGGGDKLGVGLIHCPDIGGVPGHVTEELQQRRDPVRTAAATQRVDGGKLHRTAQRLGEWRHGRPVPRPAEKVAGTYRDERARVVQARGETVHHLLGRPSKDDRCQTVGHRKPAGPPR
jgi:hypothetical protein